MNENAKEKKNSVASDGQIYRLNGFLSSMGQEERELILKGKKPEDFSRPEIKDLLDKMKDEGRELVYPPSKKQLGAITKMADDLGMTLDEVLKLVDLDSSDDLKGGKSGSASKLIGILIAMCKKLPATEKQVKLVLKESEKQGIPLSDILSIADIVTIDEMTKDDANKIITAILKNNKKSRKK